MKTVLTLFLTAFVSTSSHATLLTWTDAAFADASQISTVGSQLTAYNLGNPNTVTVNGVDFAGRETPTAGAFNDTYFRWGSNDSYTGQSGADYSALGVTGLTNTEETSLLDSFTWGNTQGIGTQMENLTPGLEYVVQILVVDNREPFLGRNMHFGQDGDTWVGGGSALVDYTSNGGTPYARLVETTFIADATTQAFRFGIQNDGSPQVNAMQIRVIPEPSTFALALLGFAGFVLRRR